MLNRKSPRPAKQRASPVGLSFAKSKHPAEHATQGLEVLKGQGKPTCATCWHCEPQIMPNDEPSTEGICFGVEPKALMQLNGQVTGAFPPVKLSWRCPNWRKQR